MKRKRVYGGPVVFKRRRTGGRKPRVFKRAGPSVASYTGNATRGLSIGFRNKRFRPRVFRSRIWNDTLYKTHYRSVLDNNFLAVTQAGTNNANGYLIRAVNSPFWQVGGGAQPANIGGTVPVFDSDIILRGGVIRLAVAAEVANDPVRCRIWLMKSNKFPNNTIITSPNLVNCSSTWDPSIQPGWREFGKIVMMRECVLVQGSNPFEVYKRIGVQKVDQDDWVTNGGYNYYWILTVSKMSLNAAIIAGVRTTWSHNVSFAADAQ